MLLYSTTVSEPSFPSSPRQCRCQRPYADPHLLFGRHPRGKCDTSIWQAHTDTRGCRMCMHPPPRYRELASPCGSRCVLFHHVFLIFTAVLLSAFDDILFTLYERRCCGIDVLSKVFLQRYLTLHTLSANCHIAPCLVGQHD